LRSREATGTRNNLRRPDGGRSGPCPIGLAVRLLHYRHHLGFAFEAFSEKLLVFEIDLFIVIVLLYRSLAEKEEPVASALEIPVTVRNDELRFVLTLLEQLHPATFTKACIADCEHFVDQVAIEIDCH